MPDAPGPEIDPRRVRLGLIFLTAVVLIALVLAVVVDNGFARLLMAGIILFTVARAWVLSRAIRSGS